MVRAVGHAHLQEGLCSAAIGAHVNRGNEGLVSQGVDQAGRELLDVKLDRGARLEPRRDAGDRVLGDKPTCAQDPNPVGGSLDLAEDVR